MQDIDNNDVVYHPFKIAPSILSADYGNMQHVVTTLQDSGAEMIHFDMMDGIFVPNLSFGPKFIKDLKKHINVPVDVHMMIGRPERMTAAVAEAGADMISFHIEATDRDYVLPMLRDIKRRKLKAGIAISPDTPVKTLTSFVDSVDYVLLMSVHPGASGQQFLPKSLDRLIQLKALIGDRPIQIQIDGGVCMDNILQIREIGVDIVVAGSAILAQSNWINAIAQLKSTQLPQVEDTQEQEDDEDCEE
ncbi:MAG: ribulose-phosphate 3-epimerase [Clostridiales bacterium]|jgi:ribulose-phosphate 3-epimerase|nr:ribulose-phosphate 3-epimerase [Clostridiales bacterium]